MGKNETKYWSYPTAAKEKSKFAVCRYFGISEINHLLSVI